MSRIRLRTLLPGLLLLCAVGAATAQDMVFQVDPAQSKIDFTLGDILHTVHGTFRMKSCAIHFDPQAGTASGALLVDATSGESGSNARDKKMHKEILESAKFPEIRFTVQKFQGAMPLNGTAQLQMTGIMTLHGSDHLLTVTAPVQFANGRSSADVHFAVPYVQWGLKNPSTFLLRVSESVDIVVHVVGTVTAGAVTASKSR
jgi:polyisoprenoid-binding protein YceI